jgi:hypothetical protein
MVPDAVGESKVDEEPWLWKSFLMLPGTDSMNDDAGLDALLI